MPAWEDAKRAAQSAYISAGLGFQDMYGSIGHAYQQILSNGHVSPIMGGNNMTQQIAEGNFDQRGINPEYQAMDRLYQAQEEERERNEAILQDFEPEPGG